MDRKNIIISSIVVSVLLISTIIFYNHKKKQESDICGGPCTYHTNVFPIVISEIKTFNDNSFDVMCINNANNRFDSIFQYYATNNSYVTKDDLVDLKVGDTVCLLEQNITSGTCTPHIISIQLVRYTQDLAKNNKEFPSFE